MFGVIQKTADELNTQTRENILGVRVIKSYNLEKNQQAKYSAVNSKWRAQTTKTFTIFASLQPMVLLVANFASVIILLIGKFPPPGSTINIVEVQSILSYQGYVILGITVTTMTLMNYVQSRASMKRINEVLDEIPAIAANRSGVGLDDGSVVFENVNFKYNANAEEMVLKDVSFAIGSGETVGVIGSTGSGKSTIANLIARSYDPLSGSIRVGSRDIREIDTEKLHNAIGYVFQQSILFAGTIRSNLLFGNDQATEDEIDRALEIACAKHFIKNFAAGIDHPVEQRGKNLSGGQKQRVSIARTILRKPKIIILDDSTSALDAITDATLRANIRGKMKGVTTIIVAQKILSIRDCDKILVVDQGAIVGEGTHEALMKDCDVYRQIASSQMSQEELDNA